MDSYFILGRAACVDITHVAQNSIICTGKTILRPFIFVLVDNPFIFVLLFQLLRMSLLAVKFLVLLTLA